ncbi:MAG: AAA family ATPase [Nitrosomonas sp.]|uniref:ATP-binding protein n=1 Tax=Nitrosomonas sp. TaxID=42353 RepID=UPI0032ED656F
MSNIEIRKATRKQAKLRIGLSGPSGSGKTYSALLLARGLASAWDKILVIDTENGSGELYSDLGEYNIYTLNAPYTPERYIEVITAGEKAGMEVIVIDSVTHEWDGKGGCLEINETLASAKFKGNTWAAWSETTPRHQKFIQAIVSSQCHVVTTARTKTDMIQTEDKKIKKVGTKEIQREGFEYELTANFNIDRDNHLAIASKDRTGLFIDRDPFVITTDIGKELADWNKGGVININELKKQILFHLGERLDIGLPVDKQDLLEFIRSAIKKLTDIDYAEENLPAIVDALQTITDKEWAKDVAWGSPAKKEEKEEDLSTAI